MAKKSIGGEGQAGIGWDHPFVRMGFVPEHLLREVWKFGDQYWRKWLRENQIPHRTLNGVLWFHSEQLGDWFMGPQGMSSDSSHRNG